MGTLAVETKPLHGIKRVPQCNYIGSQLASEKPIRSHLKLLKKSANDPKSFYIPPGRTGSSKGFPPVRVCLQEPIKTKYMCDCELDASELDACERGTCELDVSIQHGEGFVCDHRYDSCPRDR